MPTISQALALAIEHHRAGRLELAEEIYRRILAVEPDHADSLHLLGKIADDRGQYALAADYIRRAMAIQPEAAACHNSLANVLLAMGKSDEAIACYRRAVELRPDYAEAINNLGSALYAQGKLDEAIACYRKAVQHAPDYLDAINNLGLALQNRDALDESLAWCRRALELSPDDARTQTNLGNALLRLERWEEAAAIYRRVLTQPPGAASVHNHLGVALRGLGRLTEAIACHRHALELAPDDASACNNLAVALQSQGRVTEAIAWCRKALQRQPANAEVHRNLLLALEYGPDVGPLELAEAYADFDRRQGDPLRATWRPHANPRDPERILQLGFVAADFRHHPVGYSFLRVVECLRAIGCPLVCYANREYAKDAFTERFQAAAHTWREVRRLSDAALAEQIRADGIDILFDLCGHFAGGRLLTFARRPAPIQIAWTGPTGLTAIDYLLADRHLIPPGAERHYREYTLRMPDAYTCFEPPPHAPDVDPLPAAQRGYVTFGTLNNLAKINPQVIDAWAEILRRLPTSRLLLRHLNSAGNADDCHPLLAAFASAGLDASRVEIVGRAPYAERLDLYQRIDVSLDPFPFSGATTTYESLWMGVPVVALPGETYYRRMCLTHLQHAGLAELAAHDASDYADRAVALANDLPRLAALRAALRPRLAASPLYDGPRFAANLMRLLRGVWRTWCQAENAT